MVITIDSGLVGNQPLSMIRAGSNKLLMANGIDRMKRWDGTSGSAVTAGVDPPISAPAIASGAAGAISGSNYSAYVRFVDAEGNPSNLSPLSNVVASLSAKQINWTSIPVPTDTKVVKKQLIRNTSGQATIYYVVTELTNLAQTTFTDNVPDATLTGNEAVTIVDPNNQNVGNRFTVPPANKGVIALHLGRVFGAVERSVTDGHCVVTSGSTNVQGVGTVWVQSLVGRQLYIPGQPVATIASVQGAGQLTLTANWPGSTIPFAPYAIKSAPQYLRSVAWSEADYLEAWPAVNGVVVPDTGGEITGLASMASFLYVIEDKIINRFSFQSDPSFGALYIATYRGCVNNRCWVVVDDNILYMLDRNGIHAFDGGQKSDPISEPIQECFRNSTSKWKVEWRDTRYWHARHYSDQGTIRWFVTMGGGAYPHHAICYQYRLKRWWMEEYPVPMLSGSESVRGAPQVFLGSKNNTIYGITYDAVDGITTQRGTTGNVQSATRTTLSAVEANFPADCGGCAIRITSGRGTGQQSVIAYVDFPDQKKVILRRPFTVVPDSTSQFIVGGIPWKWLSGRYRWDEDEELQVRQVGLTYGPTSADERIYLSLHSDFSDLPIEFPEQIGRLQEEPATSVEVEMKKESGFRYLRLDGAKGMRTEGPRLIQVELFGVRTVELIRVYGLALDGTK